jgi:hypothetical protein
MMIFLFAPEKRRKKEKRRSNNYEKNGISSTDVTGKLKGPVYGK